MTPYRVVMVDRYTKTMLTIVALATVAIAVQMFLRDQLTYEGGCGGPTIPCYVSTSAKGWLAVRVLP